MAAENPVPGTGGDIYIPMEERTGEESIVFFTRVDQDGMRLRAQKDRIGLPDFRNIDRQ